MDAPGKYKYKPRDLAWHWITRCVWMGTISVKSLFDISRHLYAFIFAVGTFASYLIGPSEQLVPNSLWLSIVLGLTYLMAFGLTLIKRPGSLGSRILYSFLIYLVSFYFYWIVGGFAAELSNAAFPIAFYRLTLAYFVGSPIVFYKLIPALVVSLGLQLLTKRFTSYE